MHRAIDHAQSTLGLSHAIEHAQLNPITGLPKHGAVLTDGSVFFYGHNSREQHPLQERFKKHPQAIHLHAEIASIAAAVEAGHTDLSQFSLSVARVYRDGTTGPSKPCEGCWAAIAAFNLKEVQFT